MEEIQTSRKLKPRDINLKNKDQFLTYLETRLSPRRLQHSLGVMQTMEKLAGIYELDQKQALAAGLLHDIAKELEPDQQTEILTEAEIEIHCKEDKDYHYYLHGPVGAYVAQKELGIDDPTVLKAIETHTYYGNYDESFNAPINWCIRFSDILEPTRNWSKVKWLRTNADRLAEVVYSGKLKEGAFLQTGWVIKWFAEENRPIHPNMYRIFDELAKKLGVDDCFL